MSQGGEGMGSRFLLLRGQVPREQAPACARVAPACAGGRLLQEGGTG